MVLIGSIVPGTLFLLVKPVHAYSFPGGDGSDQSPYQIDTIEALYAVRDDLDASYILMNDLDFEVAGDYDDSDNMTQFITGDGWAPIGEIAYDGSPFIGIFDGNGHVISNLYINVTSGTNAYGHVGLFGFVGDDYTTNQIHIRDLGLESVNITVDSSLGATCTTGALIGGVMGNLDDPNTVSVVNCYATGIINADNRTGGLIGRFKQGTILNCWSGVNVTGDDMTGGLIGKLSLDDGYGTTSHNTLISDCFTNGTVTGGDYVGGFIGWSGSLPADYMVKIWNSYAVGNVTGSGDGVNGFIGNDTDGLDILNCFFDNQTTTQTTDDGAEGKNTAEMKTLSTYNGHGWIIATTSNVTTEVWEIDAGNDYPKLVDHSNFNEPVKIISQGIASQGVQYSQQTKLFNAEGLSWLFMANDTDIIYSTSSDGTTWTAPTLAVADAVHSTYGMEFSVHYNGTYFFLTWNNATVNTDLKFIRGEPDTDGSISWDSSQTAVSGSADNYYNYPDITVDDSGFPYIFYIHNNNGTYYPTVTKSSTNDGTWSTDSGFPYNTTDNNQTTWMGSINNIAGEGVAVAYAYADGSPTVRFYNGTWSDPPTDTSYYIQQANRLDVTTARGVLDMVYLDNETASLQYCYYNATTDSLEDETELLTNIFYPSPIITVDSDTGYIYVFYGAYPHEGGMYYLRYDGNEWSGVAELWDYTNRSEGITPAETVTVFDDCADALGVAMSYGYWMGETVNVTYISMLSDLPDLITPTYSDLSTNATDAGSVCDFGATFNDETGLSHYIFSTNNTGTWTNETATAFSTTPETINVTKTLNSTVGQVVGYQWFFNDTSGNDNSTTIQTLVITDGTVPTYSGLSTSSTVAGSTCYFNATFTDETALPSNGQYLFATNNTGTWTWDSAVNFTSTPESISVSKTLNSTVGQVVGYRWNVTDNAGNLNYTAISTLTITDGTAPTYSGATHSTTVSSSSCNFTITVNDEWALEPGGQYQFATNNTGTWVWDSAVNFTSTPENLTVTKTLNATVGLVIGYRWNITDNAGNANYTAISTLTTTEETAPTYSSMTHSDTSAGSSCDFTITINDETALPSNGQYLFGTNNTGTWVWDSAVNFTSTPENLQVTKTLNSTVSQVVGYRWNFTDNQGNANYTTTATLTITAGHFTDVSHSNTGLETPTEFNATIADADGLTGGGYYFAQNITGSWTNSTYTAFSSNPETVSNTETLGTTGGVVVGYQWFFNDTGGTWYSSDIYTLTTDPESMGGTGGGGGGGDDGDDDQDVPDGDDDGTGDGSGGGSSGIITLPELIDDIVQQIAQIPPMAIWALLGTLGLVAGVAMLNQTVGRKVDRYGRAPVRELEKVLNPGKRKKQKKENKPKRSWKLFD